MNAPLRVPTSTRTLLMRAPFQKFVDVRASLRRREQRKLARIIGADSDQLSGRRFRLLCAHLFHELPHGGNVTRRAPFAPLFEPQSGLLQLGAEILAHPLLPELRHYRLHPFPHAEELAGGLKEQVLVEQTIVE